MRSLKLIVWFLGCLLAVCLAFGENPNALKIAAAANLAPVAPVLQADFNKLNPEATVQFIFNASGTLTTQITKGAPFDIFLSADMSFPEKLKEKGFAVRGPVKYTSGRCVLMTTRTDLNLHQGLRVVADPKVKLIAIANPALAPYGAAAVAQLKQAGIWDSLQNKVVYAGTITQAFQYATTATDVGFVAKSSLYGKDGQKYNVEGLYWVDINAPVAQGMVALDSVNHKKYVKEFYDYMLSARAQKIMAQYGYTN
jgi:molybdate transport system substrate-binding protein